MVKSEVCNLCVIADSGFNVVNHINRNVAKAYALNICVVNKKFRNNARGVCEVNKPCVGANSLHTLCNVSHCGDCAKRLKEAAYTGCLLTDKVMLERDCFVKVAAGKLADAYLRYNEISTLQSKVKVVCKKRFAVDARFFEHTKAKSADYCALSFVNIHKRNAF